MTPTIFLLNTTIITTVGLTYHSRLVGITEAKSLLGITPTEDDVRTDNAAGLTPVHVFLGGQPFVVSAIGHVATAAVAATLLGMDVPVSRDAICMAPGDLAICVKLRTRAPEGAILTRSEVEAIGYDLVLLRAEDPAVRGRHARMRDDVLALLCYSDDVGASEQPYGTRRPGRWPMQVHFIMRRPQGHGGAYVRVTQEWGTDEWAWCDITASEATAEYVVA